MFRNLNLGTLNCFSPENKEACANACYVIDCYVLSIRVLRLFAPKNTRPCSAQSSAHPRPAARRWRSWARRSPTPRGRSPASEGLFPVRSLLVPWLEAIALRVVFGKSWTFLSHLALATLGPQVSGWSERHPSRFGGGQTHGEIK